MASGRGAAEPTVRRRRLLVSIGSTLVVAAAIQRISTWIWPGRAQESGTAILLAIAGSIVFSIRRTRASARWTDQWSAVNGPPAGTGSGHPDPVIGSRVDEHDSAPPATVGPMASYLWPRAVALSSPLRPDVCGERLSQATVPASFLPLPGDGQAPARFRGRIDSNGVAITRFHDTMNRNTFYPLLRGTLTVGPDGGTELRGTVGLGRIGMSVIFVTLFGATVILGLALVAGIALVVLGPHSSAVGNGHSPPAVVFLLFPLAIAGGAWIALHHGMRLLGRLTPTLLDDVGTLLECSLVTVGRAAT